MREYALKYALKYALDYFFVKDNKASLSVHPVFRVPPTCDQVSRIPAWVSNMSRVSETPSVLRWRGI